jgi:hypothetical protein
MILLAEVLKGLCVDVSVGIYDGITDGPGTHCCSWYNLLPFLWAFGGLLLLTELVVALVSLVKSVSTTVNRLRVDGLGKYCGNVNSVSCVLA